MENRSIETQTKIREILQSLTQDERKLLSGVIDAEREKLYMQKPRGINDDLWKVVTETIR
ncbi:MAG: hypothetical protein RBS80_03305 [Thermoguttaceae bacterium]|jgi:FixJ family two-component response regulator|nr:hypothetical protein [Thermoguttaceae bacterium]